MIHTYFKDHTFTAAKRDEAFKPWYAKGVPFVNRRYTKVVPFLFKIMVRATSDKQLSKTLQGFFKDKLQFSRTKIYLINRHSLPPLIILLAKTRPGVIYDFHYFGHR